MWFRDGRDAFEKQLNNLFTECDKQSRIEIEIMKLTGKCQEDFKKWCSTEDGFQRIQLHSDFYILTESMRYGVYVDFFDTANIRISMNQFNKEYWFDIDPQAEDCECLKTRTEARIAAIEKANEIYNKI